jgi:hypothetical protein
VTDDSGNVTGDSDEAPEIGHVRPECSVTFGRNGRSRSNGISGQLHPEYADEALCNAAALAAGVLIEPFPGGSAA